VLGLDGLACNKMMKKEEREQGQEREDDVKATLGRKRMTTATSPATCSTAACHQGQQKEGTAAAEAFDATHCKCRSLQLSLAADAAHVVHAGPTL